MLGLEFVLGLVKGRVENFVAALLEFFAAQGKGIPRDEVCFHGEVHRHDIVVETVDHLLLEGAQVAGQDPARYWRFNMTDGIGVGRQLRFVEEIAPGGDQAGLGVTRQFERSKGCAIALVDVFGDLQMLVEQRLDVFAV